MTEKLAVGKQMGGFMQHRQRTRPLRVETLLAREDDRSPSSVFQPEEKYERALAKDESPEFAEEPVKEAAVTVVERSVSPQKWRELGGQQGAGVLTKDMSQRQMVELSTQLKPGMYVDDGKSVAFSGGRYFPKAGPQAREYGQKIGVPERDMSIPLFKESSEKLYHYGPKDVDLTVEGLKTPHTLDDPRSTAHYISRVSQATGKPESGVTREDVLKWLESSRGPGGSRMVSVLHKPLGDEATAAQKNFASRGQLYEIDYDSARKNKLIELAQIVEERPKTQRTVRRRDLPQALREAKGYPANHPRMAFKGTPHGFVTVKGGTLPGEYLRKVGAELKPKQSEFAPGIQKARKIEGIPRVSERAANQEWMVSLSKHPAAVRGDHRDLRLVTKGRAHSWAFNDMPEPGKGTYAAQQPTHSGRYGLRKKPFSIPLGVYGGTRPGAKVEPEYVQPAEVISASNDRVHFLRHHGQETEEFVLKKVSKPPRGAPLWSLRNATKNRSTKEGRLLPDTKPRYKEATPEQIDFADDQQVMSPKLDGAHTLLSFPKAGRMMRVYSYRPTQRKSGLIEHTFKFPGFQNRKTPKSLQGTVIRAEAYATDGSGRAIPASELGGLLNASVPNSRRAQSEGDVRLRLAGIDVVRHKGKDYTDKSFSEKLEVLRQVSRETRGTVEQLPVARTPEEKKKLLSAVKAGRYPKTREGVVLHELHNGGPPTKVKFRPSHSVYVREVFTKKTTPKGQAAGFAYSVEPAGPIVGKVGTGLSRQMRKDMASTPEKFIGRVAKVQSAGRHQRRKDKVQGALVGSPAFKEWHIDKTPPELMKEGAEAQDDWASTLKRFDPRSLDPKKLEEFVKKERRVKAMMRLKSEVGKLRASWGGKNGSH